MDNRFVSFILREMTEVKKLERVLGIYAGVAEPEGAGEKVHAKIVGKAIEKGGERFGAGPDAIIVKCITP